MIEREIESRITTAINALQIEDLAVHGLWQIAGEGELKNEEGEECKAVVSVGVGPRRFESFGYCKCQIPVQLAIAVRAETDSRGIKLAEIYERVMGLIQSWHLDDNGEMRTDLNPDDGSFNVDGVDSASGSGPTLMRERSIWQILINCTIVGSVSH